MTKEQAIIAAKQFQTAKTLAIQWSNQLLMI